MGVIFIKKIRTALIAGLAAAVILPNESAYGKVENQSMFFLPGAVISEEKSEFDFGGISILDNSSDEVEFDFKFLEVIKNFFDF